MSDQETPATGSGKADLMTTILLFVLCVLSFVIALTDYVGSGLRVAMFLTGFVSMFGAVVFFGRSCHRN